MTRVLVVEDEESYSDALAYMLRKEGFEVAIAADGNTALTEFDRNGADIVLLDLMLPGIPGTEVCRQIRATSSVPVIMVSAKDDEVDKVVGLELGADDYVTKPFSPRELVARLGAVLRRSEGRPGRRRWRVGELEVDLDTRRASITGEPVDLTPTELNLLHTLLSARGRAMDRAELLATAWGQADYAGSRTVDVHVAQLRAKLGAHCPVETVRGVGYRVTRAERG